MYYIWSWEHDAWWAPRESGYTEEIKNAGAYSYENAMRIVSGANYVFNKGLTLMPNEAMVPIVPEK